jgi:hypothetical protein
MTVLKLTRSGWRGRRRLGGNRNKIAGIGIKTEPHIE